MSEETPKEQGAHPKWPLLDSFPDHEPTPQELEAYMLERFKKIVENAKKGISGSMVDRQLIEAMFPDEEIKEKKAEMEAISPEFNRAADRGAQLMIDMTSEAIRENRRADLLQKYQFRKLYEEGTITDTDMRTLYDAAAHLVETAKTLNYKGILSQDKDAVFRITIVPTYLVFRNADLVSQTAELVSAHERSTKSIGNEFPEILRFILDREQDPSLGRRHQLGIIYGMKKAREIYESNRTFDAVKAYFTVNPSTT